MSFAGSALASTASLTLLGDIPGGDFRSSGNGISADGTVATGYSYVAPGGLVLEAFRWRADLGMVSIGDLPGGAVNSNGLDVSADGSVIVGQGRSSSGDQAFRWTEAGGMVGLGDLPGGSFFSTGRAVSSDGLIVVGYSRSTSTDRREAFRWTSGTGMVGLGDLSGGSFASEAFDISGDGQVIVGYATPSGSSDQAAKWTSGGGWVALGDLPGGAIRSVANGTNTDGSVIVGQGAVADGYEAFYWTQAGGMVSLGDLPGSAVQGEAWDVSDDGAVVVGTGFDANGGYQDFIWTQPTGMIPLTFAIQNMVGIEVDGLIVGAPSISADGRVILATTSAWVLNPDSTLSRRNQACRIQLPGPGACCIGDTCTDNVDPLQCATADGVFISDEVTCASIACTDFGACCLACAGELVAPCPTDNNSVSPSCVVLSRTECIAVDGVYLGGTCTFGAACTCAADLTGDGVADVSDFNVLAANFGQGNPGCVGHAEGDMNCDGFVDVADFNVLAGDFGCIAP